MNESASHGSEQRTPLVSVIIPTYKRRDLVLETLDSIFAQTFTEYEVIVINDGSPDDTEQVLRPLVRSGRIRYFEQANQGQAAARVRGLAEAKGEFVVFLDDDDLWPPDKLEWQVQELRSHADAVLVYGYAQTLGEESDNAPPTRILPSGWVREQLFAYNWLRSPGQTLMRTAALREVGGVDPAIWGADDWDFYIRLSDRGTFIYQHRNALYYRLHSGNDSKNSFKYYLNACKVRRKYLGRIPTPKNYRNWLASRRYIKRCYSAECLKSAERLSASGRSREARAMFWNALRIKPSILRRRSILAQLLQMLRPSASEGRR